MPAATKYPTPSASFLAAVAATLVHEGGYANDPADPGGETNFGISKRSYPSLDIRALTREDAVAVYHRDFWLHNGYDRLADPALAAKLFDLCVNMGPVRAHKLLQQAVNSTATATTANFAAAAIGTVAPLTVDGLLGPATLSAVNAHPNPAWLLATLKLLAVERYLSLNKPKFLAGWVRRAIG